MNASNSRAIVPILLSALCGLLSADGIDIEVVSGGPQAAFAADEIRSASEDLKTAAAWKVQLAVANDAAALGLEPEGFAIRIEKTADGNTIRVMGADSAGVLYGGLDVAETLRTGGVQGVRDMRRNPYMAMRGTKFNIPLDVRTPSYSDVCDAAQKNIPEMWSFEFWREYIDTLARYRFNFVSLWNLHPFPSLVKVSKYPDVALDDVLRSRVEWEENYSLEGRGFVTDEILKDVETVRKMTIGEKIEFWRRVMAYGKSRGVDFYFVTWNIFTYGTSGRYGITDDFRNRTTIDYFRRSVEAMFLTYPDLAGIGLTTGENMAGADFQQKEDWAFSTYGRGVLDAAAAQPGRKIRFIHRQHQARARDIAARFRPLIDHPDIEFVFSFKYAKAHVYSATTQPYHEEFVEDLGDMKTIWTLRNDDIYYFRWGAPDFVREFIQNIPRDVSRGYYYGSDQYVWGREFLQRGVAGPRELEIVKHGYQWMLWGRLGYDPTLESERIQGVLGARFGLKMPDAGRLFDAWQHASMIYPTTTGFHWGALDFQWYIEGCQSRPGPAENGTGFHDVNRFITLAPHARSGCQSIPDYVRMVAGGGGSSAKTPPEVADTLEMHAREALAGLAGVPSDAGSELGRTLEDIRTVAALGLYYAEKIRGATHLALYRGNHRESDRQAAVAHLVQAARHWGDYTRTALKNHRNPLWTNRVGWVDWKKNYRHVLEDIRIAGGAAPDDLPAELTVENEDVDRQDRAP